MNKKLTIGALTLFLILLFIGAGTMLKKGGTPDTLLQSVNQSKGTQGPTLDVPTVGTNTPGNTATEGKTPESTATAGKTPASTSAVGKTPATKAPAVKATESKSPLPSAKATSPEPTAQTQQPKASANLAPNFTLTDLAGKTVKLSDFRGKIVLLNFWATWCPPCRKEMPEFNELDATFKKSNDIVLLAINVQENKKTVQEFLSSNGYGMRTLLDEDGSVSNTYGITGIPTTHFIDKDGSLFTTIPGMTTKQAVLDVLDRMKN